MMFGVTSYSGYRCGEIIKNKKEKEKELTAHNMGFGRLKEK